MSRKPSNAFTLIELLVVVAIIGILATIATVNIRLAMRRAWKSADAANMRTIATALQNYYVDYNDLPPADREAGPFMSHTTDFLTVGNGPAAGGSQDGLPWLLHAYGYIEDREIFFTNAYRKQYQGGETIRGGHPRFHNFRYAYNSSALSTGGHAGGMGPGIMSGETWIIRNLFLPARQGFYRDAAPEYPGDYVFPWGEGELEGKLEHVMYADFAVKTVLGGTDIPAEKAGAITAQP